ncbi:MAG TPA: prepilin peptidase [Pseudolabrys sp.]|nr:prepilin peptidase [Pseudolabrys sp.]
MEMLAYIRAFLLLGCAILIAVSAITDLRSRRIPNRIVAVIAAGGLAYAFLSWPGLVWLSLIVSVVLFFGIGTLAHFRLIGGGDVKLLAAVAFLVPPGDVGPMLLNIMIAGGVLSAGYLAVRALSSILTAQRIAVPAGTRRAVQFPVPDPGSAEKAQTVPYAVAILAGVIFHIGTELNGCLFAISCSP